MLCAGIEHSSKENSWHHQACGCADGCETCVYLNGYTPNRGAGQGGVQIIDQSTSEAMKQSTANLTIAEAQGAEGWASCKLIAKFAIADPDDSAKIYTFDTSGPFICLAQMSPALVAFLVCCALHPRHSASSSPAPVELQGKRF